MIYYRCYPFPRGLFCAWLGLTWPGQKPRYRCWSKINWRWLKCCQSSYGPTHGLYCGRVSPKLKLAHTNTRTHTHCTLVSGALKGETIVWEWIGECHKAAFVKHIACGSCNNNNNSNNSDNNSDNNIKPIIMFHHSLSRAMAVTSYQHSAFS